MTGWQGNDGGQGGWNQPYGPDPQANDPYAGQYGSGGDTYEYGPGTGGFAQQDPYQQQYYTGGFPAQGYGPPPPPPKRTNLPMILSLLAIVIIVGAVVTIVMVNRTDPQPVADPDQTSRQQTSRQTSSERESSDRESSDRTSSPDPSGDGKRDGWLDIDNTADAGLTYQVPPDWKEGEASRDSGLGVDFTGTAVFGVYECEGNDYVRTFAASGDVQGKGGTDLDVAATVRDFATSFAKTSYGVDAKVDLPEPTPVKVGDKDALTLTAKVTPTVTKPACEATEGEIAIVGVPLKVEGQPTGVAMLVVVNDLAGGPATPEPVAAQVSQDILTTVSVG